MTSDSEARTDPMDRTPPTRELFRRQLEQLTAELPAYISGESGEWTIKGFVDLYKNVYSVSGDTKLLSKILEIHLFPRLLTFAERFRYRIVPAECQNWYPDFSFISEDDYDVKFALDLKTTYRDEAFPGHVNGFTELLGNFRTVELLTGMG